MQSRFSCFNGFQESPSWSVELKCLLDTGESTVVAAKNSRSIRCRLTSQYRELAAERIVWVRADFRRFLITKRHESRRSK